MLVLFVITFAIFTQKNRQLTEQTKKLELIQEVEKALESLDTTYFAFDDYNKRYKLNLDVTFKGNSADFNDLTITEKQYLKEAGNTLYNTINKLIQENPKVEYLLIIEGNTQRTMFNGNWNYVTIPDVGYNLSYRRALSLVNYWKNECHIPFDNIKNNCELLIAGSGYFGQSREVDEELNRRFTIQVTSKVGKFLDNEG